MNWEAAVIVTLVLLFCLILYLLLFSFLTTSSTYLSNPASAAGLGVLPGRVQLHSTASLDREVDTIQRRLTYATDFRSWRMRVVT
jgi:hypothetical protein